MQAEQEQKRTEESSELKWEGYQSILKEISANKDKLVKSQK